MSFILPLLVLHFLTLMNSHVSTVMYIYLYVPMYIVTYKVYKGNVRRVHRRYDFRETSIEQKHIGLALCLRRGIYLYINAFERLLHEQKASVQHEAR